MLLLCSYSFVFFALRIAILNITYIFQLCTLCWDRWEKSGEKKKIKKKGREENVAGSSVTFHIPILMLLSRHVLMTPRTEKRDKSGEWKRNAVSCRIISWQNREKRKPNKTIRRVRRKIKHKTRLGNKQERESRRKDHHIAKRRSVLYCGDCEDQCLGLYNGRGSVQPKTCERRCRRWCCCG